MKIKHCKEMYALDVALFGASKAATLWQIKGRGGDGSWIWINFTGGMDKPEFIPEAKYRRDPKAISLESYLMGLRLAEV